MAAEGGNELEKTTADEHTARKISEIYFPVSSHG
jgi:hypothetical protein